MAVQNQLAPSQPQKSAITYKVGGNDITLNGGIVRKYLVSGNAGDVTDQEVMMFIRLCQYQGLNPFLREAYLVKYGSSPAQIVTGKGALEKRASRCERYRGFEAGIIVRRPDGCVDWRTGTFYLPDEQLVGGWAKVYVDGYTHPVEAAVSLGEYNTGKSVWLQKPATMIRKVAKSQALREAFPENMQGMYEAEERGVAYDDLPDAPIEMPQGQACQQQVPIYTDAQPVQDNPVCHEPPQEQQYDDFSDIMMGGSYV